MRKYKYKVIANGSACGVYLDKYDAMQEANRLSYHYNRVIVRTLKLNGHRANASDTLVRAGTITPVDQALQFSPALHTRKSIERPD